MTNLVRRAGVVAAGTLTSRVLGAVRDAVIAASFTVAATDAFFVAFTIPNTLRVLVGEGAASGAVIPVLSELKQDGPQRMRRYYAALWGVMLLVLVVLSVLGVWLSPALASLYAGGYEGAKFDTTVQLTRIVFPYILLAGLGALAMAALHSHGRFAVPAYSPALLNVSLIAAPFLFVPWARSLGLEPIAALALAALAGGVLQLLAQMVALRPLGMLVMPRIDFRDPAVRKTLRLIGPLMIGGGVYQINILLSRLFASFLPDGSQSFLYYGMRLTEIPQGVFALAIGAAALPALSELRARGEHETARATLSEALRLNLFIAIPASIALATLAEPTVTVIFGRGAFGPELVANTARSLTWLAVGVWAVACVRTLAQMYFAYNDTTTPVVCSALNIVVFSALSLALMGRFEHVGIAAASSCAAVTQLLALWLLLGRRVERPALKPLFGCLLRSGLAGVIMGAVVRAFAQLGDWPAGGNDPRNLLVYAAAVALGLGTYLVICRKLGSAEMTQLASVLRRRSKP